MNKIQKVKKVEKIKKELSKEEIIEKKVKEFRKELDIFIDNLSDKTRKIFASNLLDQYAWVSVSLKELSNKINGRDFIEEYRNSETQWGVRKSAYVETYNELAKTLTRLNKELIATLPKGSNSNDMLDEFNNKYKEED